MASPPGRSKVTAELELSAEALAKLRERAKGHDLDEFLSEFLEAEMRRPTLEEILKPVHEAFRASGTTDEELADELEQAKHEARRARRTSS